MLLVIARPRAIHALFFRGEMLRARSLSSEFAQKLKSFGFELLDPLGKGAYATVFRCREISTGNDMAAKIVDLKYLALRKDFEIEKRRIHRSITAQILHDNFDIPFCLCKRV